MSKTKRHLEDGLTGAEVYRRKDGKWSWRMRINGDIRWISTGRFKTRDEAVADFHEAMSYDIG